MKDITSAKDFDARIKRILITEDEIKLAIAKAGKEIASVNVFG